MTVCIGALCEGRKAVVLAADRRITLSGGHHFDRENGKIVQLAPQVLVAWSGDVALAGELIETARTTLPTSGTVTVRAAAEALKAVWQKKHMQRVEDVILKPRGYTLDSFQSVGRQQLGDQLFTGILTDAFTFGIDPVAFLVVGVDQTGASIFRVFYIGQRGGDWIECSNPLGFQTIGSGMAFAAASLSIEAQHEDFSARQTLFNVYRAKKASENVNDVGLGTDLWIVREGRAVEFDTASMERLDGVWTAYEEAQRTVPGLDGIPDGSKLPEQTKGPA
jgi:20S proteasome alpha/beta subunit